jgi:hypothetical protein
MKAFGVSSEVAILRLTTMLSIALRRKPVQLIIATSDSSQESGTTF